MKGWCGVSINGVKMYVVKGGFGFDFLGRTKIKKKKDTSSTVIDS